MKKFEELKKEVSIKTNINLENDIENSLFSINEFKVRFDYYFENFFNLSLKQHQCFLSYIKSKNTLFSNKEIIIFISDNNFVFRILSLLKESDDYFRVNLLDILLEILKTPSNLRCNLINGDIIQMLVEIFESVIMFDNTLISKFFHIMELAFCINLSSMVSINDIIEHFITLVQNINLEDTSKSQLLMVFSAILLVQNIDDNIDFIKFVIDYSVQNSHRDECYYVLSSCLYINSELFYLFYNQQFLTIFFSGTIVSEEKIAFLKTILKLYHLKEIQEIIDSMNFSEFSSFYKLSYSNSVAHFIFLAIKYNPQISTKLETSGVLLGLFYHIKLTQYHHSVNALALAAPYITLDFVTFLANSAFVDCLCQHLIISLYYSEILVLLKEIFDFCIMSNPGIIRELSNILLENNVVESLSELNVGNTDMTSWLENVMNIVY